MISFIQQEAAEKVEEIEAKAEEEFNIEKSRLVSQQRVKIIEYYDKKEKQIELQRKIQQSNLANASRLAILKARDDYVQTLKDEAKKQLHRLMNDRSMYITVLVDLITEGFLILDEEEVFIQCRHEDFGLVQRLIPDAIQRYQRELSSPKRALFVHVDEEHFLAEQS